MTQDSSAKPSLSELFEAMQAAVETDGSLKKRFNALVQFNIDGETLTLDARSGASSGEKPDLVVKTSLAILLDLVNKKVKQGSLT